MCEVISAFFSQSDAEAAAPLLPAFTFVCEPHSVTIPVSFEVPEPSLQVIEEIDLFAALRAVNVQQLTVVQLPHLLRSLASTAGRNNTIQTTQIREVWKKECSH